MRNKQFNPPTVNSLLRKTSIILNLVRVCVCAFLCVCVCVIAGICAYINVKNIHAKQFVSPPLENRHHTQPCVCVHVFVCVCMCLCVRLFVHHCMHLCV